MDQSTKDQLRLQAQNQVNSVRSNVALERESLISLVADLDRQIKDAERGTQDEENTDVQRVLVEEKRHRVEELDALHNSPYFARCEVKFAGEHDFSELYIGRFPFFEDKIYSWTAPVARLRFENPGAFVYEGSEDRPVQGNLAHKEQYMIVDGKIVFMAVESVNQPRELVYQERLQRKKSEFILPEIVEQMEKAQDEVIRAHWKGSFLISGPAGSGKTTLALHRVAYLAQSPETEQLFPSQKMIVFVQDISTKKYFSSLLPDLGITKVIITTFEEWVKDVYHLNDFTYAYRYGPNEDEKDWYEFGKQRVLGSFKKREMEKNIFSFLWDVYSEYFSQKELDLFQLQFQDRVLDRFDLTLYVKHMMMHEGGIKNDAVKYELLKGMKSRKRTVREPLRYSLIVVDEAENYLQDQIEIIRSCMGLRTQAVLYVGDLAQQTRAYTVRDWKAVGEAFEEGRRVVLHKVYRNTKEILEYIRAVGFNATIPEGLREGEKVQEFQCWSKGEEIEQVVKLVPKKADGIVGIIAKTDDYLEEYKLRFKDFSHVHVLTINEAQGVEFDAVFLVGVSEQYFGNGVQEQVREERKRVDRDLLYVALTRAMNELYVFGTVPLKQLLATLMV